MKYLVTALFFITFSSINAQDKLFAKNIVDTLCSEIFWGRGYTNNGLKKASTYLENQFNTYGLQPLTNKGFLQNFSFSVNTFPKQMFVKLDDKILTPGVDFIVAANSKGKKCKGNIDSIKPDIFSDINNNVAFTLKEKLTMTVAKEVDDVTLIEIDKRALHQFPKQYEINIDNKWIENFETNNICGFVKGTQQPDSFILITAHYDHLGGLGKNTYFPGANDNASGVALLLNLARYYAKNPQPFSLGFILFSGEEAGLLGSKYFTEHPLVDLKKIKFLINTDLAGTGEDGITVVNATEYKKEFKLLQNINEELKLLKAVNPRGKAANSDHYWFSEKGVPSFFFYTLGGIKAYHDVFDIAKTLPLSEHEDLFKLIVEFNRRLQND